MVKAIVMAGVKRTRREKRQSEEIQEIYDDDGHFSNSGYKPLTQVSVKLGAERHPMIHYSLSALDNSSLVDDITIIGKKNRLDSFLENSEYNTPTRVVQQVGSILQNAMAAYEESGADNHALFLASDIPRLTSFGIEDFLERCEGDYDLFFPIIGWETTITNKRRPPVKLVDNESRGIRDRIFDERGRRGFRVGNMVYANPNGVQNKHIIDIGYSIRKLLLPQNLVALWKYVGPDIRKKYFGRKLSLDDVEGKLSEMFGTRFKLVEVFTSESERDVDSADDLRELNGD